MRVTSILMMPQVILQILNISVPCMRMSSVELDDSIFICQSDTDIWLLIVGILIASMPFFLLLLLNVKRVGTPDQFREYNEIKASIVSLFQSSLLHCQWQQW